MPKIELISNYSFDNGNLIYILARIKIRYQQKFINWFYIITNYNLMTYKTKIAKFVVPFIALLVRELAKIY